jgi:hypothetical protein
MIDDRGKPPWIIFNFLFKNVAYENVHPKASAAGRVPPSKLSLGSDDDAPSGPLSMSLASA